jgi:hypothetical protein
MRVITAASIKYALNIHAVVQNDLSNSIMISGIAGKAWLLRRRLSESASNYCYNEPDRVVSDSDGLVRAKIQSRQIPETATFLNT